VILGAAFLCGFDVGSKFVHEWVAPQRSAGVLALLACILALGVGLPAWILTSTYYVLHDDRLDARCGPFRWRVPLREITRIEPSRTPLSGPALSLDRLRIDYRRGEWIVVSPRNREAFVRALEARRQSAARADASHACNDRTPIRTHREAPP
jgi:hypothetical protein